MKTNENNLKRIGTILYHFNISIIKVVLKNPFTTEKVLGPLLPSTVWNLMT